MNLYRLPTKRSARISTPDSTDDPPPATTTRDAQREEPPHELDSADFGGVVTSPKGTWRGHLYMAKHWRLFFFGIGAGGMLLLFADRLALVLSAISQILRPTGVPTVQ